MNNYDEFIKQKQINTTFTGIQVDEVSNKLYNFQKIACKWALNKGRSAIFSSCGTGKTHMQLEWANHILQNKGSVLILAPLAVSEQSKREGSKFGIKNVKVVANQEEIDTNCINITNYEKLHKFNPSKFQGLVLDECFPPDTPIDVFNIDNSLTSMRIKDINVNDKIYNAKGVDYVRNICKRQINRAIQITYNGKRITCSENHPFFTMYGWRCAKDLRPGDNLMATNAAMRLVRGDFQTEIHQKQNGSLLREILLGEMADEHTRTQSKSTYGSCCKKTWYSTFKMVKKWTSKSIKRDRKNYKFESNPRINKKNGANKNKKWNTTSMEGHPWWKWDREYHSTTDYAGYFGERMDCRICNFIRKTTKRISNQLQGRYWKSEVKNWDRDRWNSPCYKKEKINRCKERKEVNFFRVDNITILEQGHPELEKYRDEKGHIYFYDIEATWHPSFSVNDCLVHNSGILKNHSGKYRTQIIEFTQTIPYRLACTATPAPNDYMELANHAEYLGIMSRSEVLATFFIHDSGDTGKWRLKGHVKDNIFWQWMSTWAIMFSDPHDLGCTDDPSFELPPLKYHQHFIKCQTACNNSLFHMPVSDLNDRRRVRKESVESRCQEAAKLINNTDERWLIWAGLNTESELIKKLVNDCVEVTGSQKDDLKKDYLLRFAEGGIKRLVTKPKIAAHGMNLQVCNNIAFIGLSDSFEQLYQAIRRSWRYGQTKQVDVHFFLEEREGPILKNLMRKEKQAKEMQENMIRIFTYNLSNEIKTYGMYNPKIKMELPEWIM